MAIAGVALLLTGYLTYASLTGDGKPVGCGDVAGCGAVLGTKWSKVIGLPVSALAVGLYLGVLAVLLQQKRLGGVRLAFAATAIIGAGIWFTYVQLFEVEAICKYCMADHAIGLALAIILLSGSAKKHLWSGLVAGGCAIAVLAGVQWNSSAVQVINQDGSGTRVGRVVTLFDGRLTLNLDQEIVFGDATSDRLLVRLFDYNCPHCRQVYDLVNKLPDAQQPGGVVAVPVPLNPACNPYMESLPRAAFEHSCELARLALAIHQIAPEQLSAYEAWAYGEGWPHTAEQGHAFARTLVDPSELQTALADPGIDQAILRNVEAWGQARDADLVGGLPVLAVPGGKLTYGKNIDADTIQQLWHPAMPSPSDTPPVALEESINHE